MSAFPGKRVSMGLLASLGVGGIVLCAISAAISVANAGSGGGALWATVGVVTIAAPVGVGLYAWRRDPGSRFGPLLVVAGYGWFLTTLAHSDQSVLYSVGRVAAWVFEAVLIYVLLAYPSGRLTRWSDRTVVAVAALTVLILYLPTAFVVDHYPIPAPYTGCTDHCPANSFQLTSSQPGIVDAVVRPVRDVLTVGVFLAAAVLLVLRMMRATPLYRRTLRPVLGAAVLRCSAVLVYFVLRRSGVGEPVLGSVGLIAVLTIPAVSVGFLWGLLSWRVYSAGALERLTLAIGEARNPERLRALIAEAIGDPALELYRGEASTGRWWDSDGNAAELTSVGNRRLVCEVGAGTRTAVALVCDPALHDQRDFIHAVGSCALASLENQRLGDALRASLRDVEASRARIATAADTERHRIERDLHDGAQQELVTLRVRLELAAERMTDDPAAGAALLADLGPEIDEIIDHIRSLAHDIYPPALSSGGLADALRSAAIGSRLPVDIEVDGVARYPIEVESAIYFCCLEALQNAGKHADGATGVSIELEHGDESLRFRVVDDGCGFPVADAGHGSGLTNMGDRLDAVGGSLSVESTLGGGTRIGGMVPVSSG